MKTDPILHRAMLLLGTVGVAARALSSSRQPSRLYGVPLHMDWMSCMDDGPWRCDEEGCPAGMVDCELLSKVCDAHFSDLWVESPPRGLQQSRIYDACPVSCGLCGLHPSALDDWLDLPLANWSLLPSFLFAIASPRAFHVRGNSSLPTLRPSLALKNVLAPFARRWTTPYVMARTDGLTVRLELEELPPHELKVYSELLAGCPPLSDKSLCPSDSSFTAHLYISTNRSTGRAHHDLGAVLVLQLLGQKEWQYAPAPSRRMSETSILSPGSVLWLPAGSWHRAVAVGSVPSIHLTLELGPFSPISTIEGGSVAQAEAHSHSSKVMTALQK